MSIAQITLPTLVTVDALPASPAKYQETEEQFIVTSNTFFAAIDPFRAKIVSLSGQVFTIAQGINTVTSEINLLLPTIDAAGTYATTATNKAADAQKLATTAYNVQYTLSDGTTTGYSALHYATVASADAQTATTKANEAATSATSAANSATAALNSATLAATYATGSMRQQGNYDASTGVYPAAPTAGDFWRVSVAGTIGGISFGVGDDLVYWATGWDKIDNQQTVSMVNGKVGNVTLAVADISGAAPVDSPIFTGIPTAPTAIVGDSSTKLATTAFVSAAISAIAGAIQPPSITTDGAADTITPETITIGNIYTGGTDVKKVVIDIGNANFTVGASSVGTAAKVGNTVEIMGIVDGTTSLTVPITFTSAATYTIRAMQEDSSLSSIYSGYSSIIVALPTLTSPTLGTISASYTELTNPTFPITNYDALNGYVAEDVTDVSNLHSVVHSAGTVTVTLGDVAADETYSWRIKSTRAGYNDSAWTTVSFTVTNTVYNSDSFALHQRGVDADLDPSSSSVLTSVVAQGALETDWNKYNTVVVDEPINVLVSQQDTSNITISAPVSVGDKIYLYDGVTFYSDRTAISASIFADGSTNTNIATIVPQLTSNTTPAGTAFVSSAYTVGTEYRLFDRAASTPIFTFGNGVLTNLFAGYIATSSVVVNKFSIYANVASRFPKTFKLQGSNNTTTGVDGTWVDIGTNFVKTDWTTGQKAYFSVTNATAYLAYRIYIADINGATDYCEIYEIEFIAELRYQLALSAPCSSITKAYLPKRSYTAMKLTNDIIVSDFVEDVLASTPVYAPAAVPPTVTSTYSPVIKTGRYVQSRVDGYAADTTVKSIQTNLWKA